MKSSTLGERSSREGSFQVCEKLGGRGGGGGSHLLAPACKSVSWLTQQGRKNFLSPSGDCVKAACGLRLCQLGASWCCVHDWFSPPGSRSMPPRLLGQSGPLRMLRSPRTRASVGRGTARAQLRAPGGGGGVAPTRSTPCPCFSVSCGRPSSSGASP